MKSTIYVPAARLALTLGIVAGAWLIPLTPTPAAEAFPSSAAVKPAAGPEIVHLAQAAPAPAESPVSYSSDQADRGEDRFAKDCEECHGSDLRGGLIGGPPLRGVSFEEKYVGDLPASLLFAFMSSTMPPNAPGRYSADTYADLMAYILKRNGFRAGAPLPADMDALDYLIMTK